MSLKWFGDSVINDLEQGLQASIEHAVKKTLYKEVLDEIFGPKHGRWYLKDDGTWHHASAPGEPFANDTGASVEGIEFRNGILSAELVSTDEKNFELEFGGQNAPRPVYRPAMINAEKAMMKDISNSIKKVIK